MKIFSEPLKELSEYNAAADAVAKGKFPIQVTGCMDSQKCQIISGIAENYRVRLIITYSVSRAREIYEDMRLFEKNVFLYPAKDVIFFNADIHGNAIVKERIKAIRELAQGSRVTVVTTIDAGFDRLEPISEISKRILELRIGDEIPMSEIEKKLVELGYARVLQVAEQGEFAVRGGIVDVYPLTEEVPYRIELFGDEIDLIKAFDAESQRAVENVEAVTIYPATEYVLTEEERENGIKSINEEASKVVEELRKQMHTEEAYRLKKTVEEFTETLINCPAMATVDAYINSFLNNTVSFFEYFGDDTLCFIDEPSHIEEKGNVVEEEFRQSMGGRLENGYILPSQADIIYGYKKILGKLLGMNTIILSMLDTKYLQFKVKEEFSIPARSISSYVNNFTGLVKDIETWNKNGYRIIILCGSRTRAERCAAEFRDNCDMIIPVCDDPDKVLQKGEKIIFCGNLGKGFEYTMIKFVVIPEDAIFGAERRKKRRKVQTDGQKVHSLNDLSYGDYVVHENHGIGIYRGIEKIVVDKVTKDYIKIEYAGSGVLYVLATGLDVIQKYAAADTSKKIKVNKLNSVEWKNTKARVKGSVTNMAQELVRLYAMRQMKEGFACLPDDSDVREFEEAFPYEETEDQLRAIEDTKRDMESKKIMDRLVCGDVGFGKTEIAIRAAYKAIMNGKQVAVLVPTTVLAQQHYNTFLARMRDYGIEVGLLSRFRTAAQQKKTIEMLKSGRMDVVVGTHRLLSKDVEFKNLGLLVVDEEQRFGVAHKERIKQMKGNVDALTLTATPIPRTLHMSLIGIRDMSLLEEAPVDRQPIQTFIMEHSDEMVKEAINRELSRDGQVYYVYNRVNGIEEIAANVQKLVPDAVVAFAHGQMSERTLEKIMFDFINGDIDVLIATTIIETGLDISNVNTIIIDNADALGLSQLYQLRGRVGRSSRAAYAFLMYRRDKALTEIAEKRLSAIKEFTDLGSGYKIATRDLEIRGAGNLLGTEQSGHIESIGYDLYCKMLNEEVRRVKGEKTMTDDFETTVDISIDAYIPSSYIMNEMQKLDMYKRIAEITSEAEKADMEDEFTDRFGEIPASVENLMQVALIKSRCHRLYVTQLTCHDKTIKFVLYKNPKINPDNIPALLEKYAGRLKYTQIKEVPCFIYEEKSGTSGKVRTAQQENKFRPVETVEKLLTDMEEMLLPEEAVK